MDEMTDELDMCVAECVELRKRITSLEAELAKKDKEIQLDKLINAIKEDQMKDNFTRCKQAAEFWKDKAETLEAENRRLLEALELEQEYMDFVEESNKSAISIAYIHGWRCPENEVIKGQEYRDKIKAALEG